MNKKRVNPRRRPVTAADVNRARKDAEARSLDLAIAIILMALFDRGFLSPEQMRPAWDAINDKSDSIIKGYCKYEDLRKTLADEYGIYVGGN
jgi:hypothetical protein